MSKVWLFSSACIFSGAAILCLGGEHSPLPVAPSVDLTRYTGKWYEVARLPIRFESKCKSDVTAHYSIRKNGTVEVRNRCRKANGDMTEIIGTAHPAEKSNANAKLKVSFFWPFSADYWILDLDPEYRWALVGTPNRKYLWVLSRASRLDPAIYNKLLSRAKELGFNIERVEATVHTA